jgi:hypothetical protein
MFASYHIILGIQRLLHKSGRVQWFRVDSVPVSSGGPLQLVEGHSLLPGCTAPPT